MDPVTFHHGGNKAAFMGSSNVSLNPRGLTQHSSFLVITAFLFLKDYHPLNIWVVYCQLMTESYHVSRVKHKPFEDYRTAII